ncbi:hypothetical protein EON80_20945 [bacterium]|nr:MAG: hypothetical protein EON80_20945 [bacterium]
MESTHSQLPPDIEALLALASTWCEEQERLILSKGVPLTAEETGWAKQIGVAHPDRVRLLCVDEIPQPEDPTLRAAAELYGFLSPGTMGMALRYGILIRDEVWREKPIIFHELVHTAQYERLGGMAAFLNQYLVECLTVGYEQSPLEREAVTLTQQMMEQDAGRF